MTQSIKIIQHADDCTLLLKEEASLKTCLEMIQRFSKVSGRKLNPSIKMPLKSSLEIFFYKN